jgi:predicted kinase
MATILMSIGIAGSGKSTLMKKIAKWGSFEYIGPDAIRFEKHGDERNHFDDKAVWVELRSRVADSLSLGRNIVVDSTFHTAKRREHFLAFAREHGAKAIEGLYFDVPLTDILSRSGNRAAGGGKHVTADFIRKTYTELQENIPTPEEGFDSLFRIDAQGDVEPIQSSQGSMLLRFFSDQKST